MSKNLIILFLCSCVLSACTFVQLTDKGANVAVMSTADVQNCAAVGVVSSATQDKVVVERGSAKVREELLVLARNQAADLGANAIVAISEPEQGKQSFRAYRC